MDASLTRYASSKVKAISEGSHETSEARCRTKPPVRPWIPAYAEYLACKQAGGSPRNPFAWSTPEYNPFVRYGLSTQTIDWDRPRGTFSARPPSVL
jgi:hypothetical protein